MNRQDPLYFDKWAALSPAADVTHEFAAVVADWNGKRLILPEHQRGRDVWTADKRRRYVERIKRAATGAHPPGAFATYQLVDEPGPKYLNDGLQRLTTLADLDCDPARYELDRDSADALLRVTVSIQHRWYESHEDAMKDFQLINDGTPLTPYELCSGILKYAPRYVTAWKPMLESADRSVRDSEARLTAGRQQGRKQDHQRNRDVWAICHRFLSEDRRTSDYPDLSAADPLLAVEKRQTVEHKLRDLLEEQGPDKMEHAVKTFQAFLGQETALLEQWMTRIYGPGEPMAPSAHRWLLHVAIWRRNNEITRAAHEEFAENVLRKARDGYWRVEHDDGRLFKTTLGAAKLSLLPRIAELAGMPGFVTPEPRERGRRLKPGYDNSHKLPYATHGNGPTFPEPGPLNRARGAKPVDENPDENPEMT